MLFRYETQSFKGLGNRYWPLQLMGATVYFKVELIYFFCFVGRPACGYDFQTAGPLGAGRHTCTTSDAAIGASRADDVLCAKATVDTIVITNSYLTIPNHCHLSLTPWAW
ncbi:hypothetical protein JCM12294_06650 [Desulfocicer niacini]